MQKKVQETLNPKAYDAAKLDRNYKSFMNPKSREVKRAGNVKKAGNKQVAESMGGLLESVKRYELH